MYLRFVLLLAFVPLAAANAELPQKAKSESFQRWRESRFGMFIHWGPVSLKETEISWSRANSNPKCPNNGQIPVAIAKATGMKYMVLTAKHCDGFLLWDSKVDDYNIMHTPFKRDVFAELAKAAHKTGMSIGWYYSPMDCAIPIVAMRRCSVRQTNASRTAGAAQQLRPDRHDLGGPIHQILHGQVVGKHHGGTFTRSNPTASSSPTTPTTFARRTSTATSIPSIPERAGLVNCPVRATRLPPKSANRICDGWFWDQARAEQTLRSAAEIAATVRKWNARHANFLLNVPPDTTGRMPEMFVTRLKEVGKLLENDSSQAPATVPAPAIRAKTKKR